MPENLKQNSDASSKLLNKLDEAKTIDKNVHKIVNKEKNKSGAKIKDNLASFLEQYVDQKSIKSIKYQYFTKFIEVRPNKQVRNRSKSSKRTVINDDIARNK